MWETNYKFQNEKKNSAREVGFHLSQTEKVMCCRQEKSYGGELVSQIFIILGYLNLSLYVLPVVLGLAVLY